MCVAGGTRFFITDPKISQWGSRVGGNRLQNTFAFQEGTPLDPTGPLPALLHFNRHRGYGIVNLRLRINTSCHDYVIKPDVQLSFSATPTPIPTSSPCMFTINICGGLNMVLCFIYVMYVYSLSGCTTTQILVVVYLPYDTVKTVLGVNLNTP